jgi:hypothetical protein
MYVIPALAMVLAVVLWVAGRRRVAADTSIRFES